MKILITNDDGVNAAQLLPLIRWCQGKGQVTVVVPKFEQSGKSHSIELHKAFEIRQVELEPGITVWTVDSTPADCVRFAVSRLEKHYDLVISGINRGFNLGMDTLYSGTFSAASEAAIKGMKAIALSTSLKYYDRAVEHLDAVFAYLEHHRLLEQNDLYNINIPPEPKGIRITRQGGPYFADDFVPVGNDLYKAKGYPVWEDASDDTLDTDAAMHGYITVTPMTINRTDRDVYEKLLTSI